MLVFDDLVGRTGRREQVIAVKARRPVASAPLTGRHARPIPAQDYYRGKPPRH